MCVTGSPVSPSSFIALMPEHGGRLDVPDEGLVDVVEGHARIVQREQPGVPGEVGAGDVLEHPEAHHADAGDGDAVEPEAVLHRAPPAVAARAGRKR